VLGHRRLRPERTFRVQLLVSVGVVATLLLSLETLSPWVVGLAGSWVLLATIVWGGLFEGKRWAWPLELGRMLGAVGLLMIRWGRFCYCWFFSTC